MRRAVITGPTGAIGMALINELNKQGIRAYAVVRKGSGRSGRIQEGDLLKKVECSLEELSQLPQLIKEKCDVFYHFAWAGTFGADARNNTEVQVKNIQYTLEAVEAAARLGCKRFIGAGSQAEYGRFEGSLNATLPTFPENGYGIAKLAAGQLSRIKAGQLFIEHIWTRILSVYGPYDGEKTMVMSTISSLLSGKTPGFTKGEQMWDYLYSADAARAFALLGEKGASGKTYVIGSGKARPLREYIEEIRDIANPGSDLDFGAVPYSEKQVMYLCADISELAKDTGFMPSYTFREGLEQTVNWYKNEISKKN